MKDTAQQLQVDLFAENLPSLQQLDILNRTVNATEKNRLDFSEQVDANISKTSAKTCLSCGIGLYILDRNEESLQKLRKASDCKEKYLYLAFAAQQLNDFAQAVRYLDKSLKFDADKNMVGLIKVATHRCAGNFESAQKELDLHKDLADKEGEYHYQLGRLAERQGLYDEAMESFEKALELSPNHQRALFHLAYRCDISGDEDAAIDYYKQVVAGSPAYVSALLNLAVLYEDEGEFDKASACVEKVLKAHPNHARARIFQKDIQSSKTMYFDEEKKKKKDRTTQILETPMSDFELSVRSRNCLKKMKIRTLGNLLNITEAELLSYKNFGETSLKEIKLILEPRGLYLGMALEDKKLAAVTKELSRQEKEEEDQQILNKPVTDVQLSIRTGKCLERLNVRTIGDLARKTEAELLGCKNFGVTSLNEIKNVLSGLGLSLRNLE